MAEQGVGQALHVFIELVYGIDAVASIGRCQDHKGIVGERHPQQFLFPGSLFFGGNIQAGEGNAGHLGGVGFFHAPKQAGLSGIASAGLQLGECHNLVQGTVNRAPGAKAIEGTCLDQAFQGPTVQTTHVSTAAKVVYGLEGAVFLPFLNQRSDGSFADGFYRSKPKSEARCWPAFLVNGKELAGPVYVRQQHRNLELGAFVDGADDSVRIIQPGIQDGTHVLQGIVGLEVGRPVGDKGIADAVGLVEGIAGEGFDEVKNLDGQLAFKPLALGAVNKPVTFFGHQRGDFLAHGLPYRIRLAQRITGKPLQDQEHLVLVNDHAVCLVQQFFQAGVGIGDGRAPVLGLDKSVDVLHWARPIESNHGGDVTQVGGFQLLDVALHPGAFQLEEVGCLARGKQFKRFLVVQRQAPEVYLDTPGLVQQLCCPVQDGQVGQPQEVHFEQAQLGHRVHGVLGHEHRTLFVTPCGTLQGHGFRQGFVGDQDARGVGADVMNYTFKSLGIFHQAAYRCIRLESIAQFRIDSQGVLNGTSLEGDHAGYPVDVAVAHAQAAPHVPQGGLGAHRAKSNDLGHPVAAVSVDNVMEHFVPPVVLEVHVYIGHFLAFQVKEPLKHQAIFQGIDVGDAEAVEGHAGCRAAPNAKHYAVAVHEVADVPDHQEVVGELGITNHLQFVLKPLLGLGCWPGIATSEAFPTKLGKVFVSGHITWRWVLGQVGLSEAQLHVAHVRDQPGVFQCLGVVGEKPLHFLRAFDVVRVVLHPQALFVLDRGIGLDADVQVLKGRLMLSDIVGVVGDHQGNTQLLAEPGQAVVYGRQLRHMLVALQFQEITIPEQFPVLEDLLAGPFGIAVNNKPGHFRRGAAGEADQALVILLQEFPINAGAIMKAFKVPLGYQLHQITVAGVIPGQQDQVIRAAVGGAAVVATAMGNVNLAADDGLYPCFLALRIKVHRAVEAAVVGDGEGVHSHVPDPVDEVGNAADAIKHAVFGVRVQVSEQRADASVGWAKLWVLIEDNTPSGISARQKEGKIRWQSGLAGSRDTELVN